MGLRISLPIGRDSLKSGSHKAEFDCTVNRGGSGYVLKRLVKDIIKELFHCLKTKDLGAEISPMWDKSGYFSRCTLDGPNLENNIAK